jgi:hypothetical protein
MGIFMEFKRLFFIFMVGISCVSPVFAQLRIDSSDFAFLAPAPPSVEAPLSILSVNTDFLASPAATPTSNFTFTAPPEAPGRTLALALTGRPLNYPNPFRLASTGTTLGYVLTDNAPIQIKFYSILGQMVGMQTYNSGDPGGKAGYNAVPISISTFGGNTLSAGIYFYLVISDGKVLGKGKMAVNP